MTMQDNHPLRPYTFLELLDRTFRLYREGFVKYLVVAVLVIVPLGLFSQMMTQSANSSQIRALTVSSSRAAQASNVNQALFNFYLILLVIYTVSYFVNGLLLNSIVTVITSEKHFGHDISLREAFSIVRSRWLTLGGGLLRVYGLILMISVGLTFALCLLGFGVGVVIYLSMASYAFLVPVLVLERTSARDGVGRAWELGKSRFWSIFRMYLIMSGASFLWSVLLLLVLRNLMTTGSALGISQPVQIVLEIFVEILFAPLLPIAFTLMYYDARVRVEGLDIVFGAINKPDTRPADVASPQPFGWSLVSQDYVNMGILSVATMVIVVAVFGLAMAAVAVLVNR
jgi:hypothetical protein